MLNRLPTLLLVSFATLTLAKEDALYREKVLPFIESHCIDCHDSSSARAGFRIDLLSDDFTSGNQAGLWKEVMDNINSGEMPPKKKKRPDAAEAFEVASWVAGKLKQTELAAQGAGGRVPIRRMNRVEYANTVRDLFQIDSHLARRLEKELPADGKVGGFDRGAAGLFMDEAQLNQYMNVADKLLDEALFLEKPEVKYLTYDGRKEKHIHGIGAVQVDENGKVIDDNPPPEVVESIKEPLKTIEVDKEGDEDKRTYRQVPHGPFKWKLRDGGIEYLTGGNDHRYPGNLMVPFYPEDFAKKGITRDGWYRIRVQAAAFKGEGETALKEVKLVFSYNPGTPLEIKQQVVVDNPIGQPKEYEFLVWLQQGPPDMNRNWVIGWDHPFTKTVIQNPLFEKPQWEPVLAAGRLQDAMAKKESAEIIADLRKKVDEAHAAALENRKTFPGPFNIYSPELDAKKVPRLWVGNIAWEGPLVDWPPKGRDALFFDGMERTDDAYIREIFAKFLPRAYRRPVSKIELDAVVSWVAQLKKDRQLDLPSAVREGVKNVLCSPAFLYLGGENIAAEKPTEGPQPIDSFQLASRLSYLLWSSAPDMALLSAAHKNELKNPATLRDHVKRMIADPKSEEFVRSFAGQWLSVRNFNNGTPPDREFYRTYDDALRDSSRDEPMEFFGEVLRNDRSLLNFIDSKFLMVNERLAKHYGLEGVSGDHFRPVAAPPDGRRGGVLGMSGIHTFLADGTRTLPVRRATWVLDTLWNKPVPPPPPDAGELPPIKGKNLTVRERLDQHRLSENCASCHKEVDSFGLALENYDAIGQWRDRQNGEGMKGEEQDPVLDVSGHLPSGKTFVTLQEFKTSLLSEKEMFVKGFTEKLLCYALGRPIGYGDHIAVERIAAHAAKNNYRFREIIQAVVASEFFQTK